MAAGGGDPGDVLWSDEDGSCAIAVILAPDASITETTLVELGLLGVFDALATLAPPQVPIAVAPGGVLLIDGARAASVRGVLGPCPAPGSPPGWAVLTIDVVLSAPGENPGETPGETSLAEEGFGEVEGGAMVEQFCRHLLVWIDTWCDAGADELASAVEQRGVSQEVGSVWTGNPGA